MNKKVIYSYKGANQDFTKSKHPVQYYFEAGHIRVLATDSQSTGSVTNEKGNSIVASLPDIKITTTASKIEYGQYDLQSNSILNPTTLNYSSGNEIDNQILSNDLSTLSLSQKIIGHTVTREGVVLFSNDGSVIAGAPEIPANSNLLLQTENFSDGNVWSGTSVSTTSPFVDFPDDPTFKGSRFTTATSAGIQEFRRQQTFTKDNSNRMYTLSFYLKPNPTIPNSGAGFQIIGSGGNMLRAKIQLNSGAIYSTEQQGLNVISYSKVILADGWIRYVVRFNSGTDTSLDFKWNLLEIGTNQWEYLSSVPFTQSFYIRGVQLVEGLLTPYIESGVTQSIIPIIPATPDTVTTMDCIWLLKNVLDNSYNLELLYVRNLEFSENNPIQAIFNYENGNIQKVYWVDGLHQVRFLNLTYNEIDGNDLLIDLPSNSLNFVGSIDFSQPKVIDVFNGGVHTSGMIQYGYNLYRLNSSQTKLSPLSVLVPLDKGTGGGGAVNETVGAIPVVKITDIDLSYTHIKVYAIKYTSFNQIPSINLIEERELSSDVITLYDDGTTISSLSLSELLFLGSEPVVPRHIETKDNRLFLANITTKDFILPDELDTRAYGFPINSSTTVVYDDISVTTGGNVTGTPFTINNTFAYSTKLDGINLNYDTNRYKRLSSSIGGTGKFVTYEIIQKSLGNPEDYRLLKDREIYRIGIQFYNSLGQTSLPKWIVDFKAPTGNLSGNYNTLKVSLTPAFYTWLDSYAFTSSEDKPVGYKIIRADRTLNDKTIICQGILSGMMVNSPRSSSNSPLYSLADKRIYSDIHVKMPNILVRTFEEIVPLKSNKHLEAMQIDTHSGVTNPLTEIQYDASVRRADTYQYSAMYQMFSPEILFDSVSLSKNLNLTVIGGLKNTFNGYWGQAREIATKSTKIEGKTFNKIHPSAPGGSEISIQSDVNYLMDRGLIDDTNGTDQDEQMAFNQWGREFNTFIPATNIQEVPIYGTPELTVRGQGNTVYNNDSKFEYKNSLEGLLTDGEYSFQDAGTLNRAIVNVNSWGGKNVTFVLGQDNVANSYNRNTMEQLHVSSGLSSVTDIALIGELTREPNAKYLSGIYGGNSYEDKKRTTYIELGAYNDIATAYTQIDSAGDIYVQKFKFERIAKTDTEVYAIGANQYTEVVEFIVETTVDLKNRNDISNNNWDSKFQPRYSDYHTYNSVYSQHPNLVRANDTEFTFRRIKTYDTRVQASKLKIPNESIDSWSDLLVNETIDLNGKHGPINSLISFKDNIFAFQDESIAAISINPRVQVQGSDGVAIELGRGSILYDYNYITTKSGSINKWGVIPTKKGIYYYDALNKSIGRVPDATNIFLSDAKGLHSFFNNNFNYDNIKIDNPLLKKGAVLGHDNYNNDIFITLLQGSSTFTWCYNELLEEFVDLKPGYSPSRYINKGEKFIITNTNDDSLYEQYAGNYNTWFGVKHPSYIILQVNPESNMDCVFDNIEFNSEIYLNDIDQPDKTLSHITSYNEYQNSGRIPLIVGRNSNIRRKFRKWRADIPRNRRNRMRNPWLFLKLELDNTSNYKMILHDLEISYTVN